MGQYKKPNTSPYNIFGIPIDGDSGYPQLIRLVCVICGLTLIALYYEIGIEKQGIYKSIFATIEHSANVVPLSICILILFDLGRRKVMSLSKWLDDKYNEKRELRTKEREDELIAESEARGKEIGYAQGKAEGVVQGRAQASLEEKQKYNSSH